MADGGGTTTLIQIDTEGPYPVYLLRNTSMDTTETIPFDGPANSPVVAEDKVIIIGGVNFTTEKQEAGSTLSFEYDESNKHFTMTESGAADDDVAVVFIYISKSDPQLGD